jgi:hypothetical protein
MQEFWLKYGQFAKVFPLLWGQTGAQNSMPKSQKMAFPGSNFQTFLGVGMPQTP